LNKAEIADTWGVLFVSPNKKVQSIYSVLDFFKYVYDGVVLMRNLPCIEKYKETLIVIESDDFSSLNFGESKDNRADFIRRAELATITFLNKSTLEYIHSKYSACLLASNTSGTVL
jgi:hypothetical protein